MKEHDSLRHGIDRFIPILGWITFIGIALVGAVLVLGLVTVSLWLALLFFIKILPILLLLAIAAVIWRLVQERRTRNA